jgi:hypothetical protein
MTNGNLNDWRPLLYYDEDNTSTISLSLPSVLTELDFEDLSDIFSLDTWNHLNEDERSRLQVYTF